MATLMGNISPTVKRLKIQFLPRNSRRENTNATNEHRKTVSAVVETMTIKLFFIMPQKDGEDKINLIFVQSGGLGMV
jgi:hypothetical protein